MLVAALYTGLSPRRAVVQAKELSVPSHPQLARTFSSPVHMQVCASNSGALDVANLILAATRQCQPHLSFKVVETHSGVLQTHTTHLLVYLNGQAHTKYYPLHTFALSAACSRLQMRLSQSFNDDGSTAALVRQALDGRSGGKTSGRSSRFSGPARGSNSLPFRFSTRGRSEMRDGRERSETEGNEPGRSLKGTDRR